MMSYFCVGSCTGGKQHDASRKIPSELSAVCYNALNSCILRTKPYLVYCLQSQLNLTTGKEGNIENKRLRNSVVLDYPNISIEENLAFEYNQNKK